MTISTWALDAVTGSPAYSGRGIRQPGSTLLFGGTAARPLGGRSGVRPRTSTTTVTASSTTWTVKPHSGMLDVQAAVEASCYLYAVNADVTGAMTAAHASFARIDIICAKLDDPAESDGSSVPAVTMVYTAGTASGSPVAPATPARSMLLATISVPASGGGSPTVSWVAPYMAVAGGIVTVRSVTERAALATAFPPTTEAPLFVYRADIKLPLMTVDATNWKTLDGKFYWANAAARTAATGMVTGDMGYQVDTLMTYRYSGSAWVAWDAPWATNTPTLTGATTNPTGQAVTGRWTVRGGVVTFFFSVTAGASPGSGDYSISLPVSAALNFAGTAGSARIYDASTGSSLIGARVAVATATTLRLQYSATYLGGLTNVGAAAPWTWAANDLIDGFVIYEAA